MSLPGQSSRLLSGHEDPRHVGCHQAEASGTREEREEYPRRDQASFHRQFVSRYSQKVFTQEKFRDGLIMSYYARL